MDGNKQPVYISFKNPHSRFKSYVYRAPAMDYQIKKFLAPLFLLLLAPLFANAARTITICNKADRHALLGFKSGLRLRYESDEGEVLQSDEGKVLPSWNKSADCCQWSGITCNSGGNVIALNMEFASEPRLEVDYPKNPVTEYLPRLKSLELLNLSSIVSQNFPIELARLPLLKFLYLRDTQILGHMPPELANFTKLEGLDLGNNQDLHGNLDVLCRIPNLNYLSMHYTAVSGVIPRCFGDLSKLKYLDLSQQALNGKIPEQLGKLSNLVHLDLSDNNFGQKIPFQLCNLTKLQYLNLGGNGHLTGNIPACFGGLSELTELSLDGCALNGEIPSSLSKLSKLQRLALERNTFVGSISSWMAGLGDLQYLGLGNVEGGHLGGVISESLGNLTKLRELILDNLEISGGFPKSFTNLKNLEVLHVSFASNLAGNLPDLGKLSKLRDLQIYETGVSGSIPDSIGKCFQLVYLRLSENSLSGAIPKALGNLSNLFELHLYDNEISGTIPSELGKLQRLSNLYMQSNKLSGQIPTEIGNLVNLQYLDLSNNSLTGSIPASFGRLSSLYSMDISYNKLNGPLPEIKSTPPQLWTLRLQNNELKGGIPAWVLNTTGSIHDINLSHNQFTTLLSTIPPSSSLDLHANRLQGTIRFNFTVDLGQAGFMYSVDLSENEFTGVEYTGDRPDAGADTFSPLQYLSLAGNKIKGKIPGFIGNRMNEFETLDLSRNQFFGEIPAVFVNLTRLTSFNVSNNHLRGEIPQGGVINSFPVSAFENNDGLCGQPLPACK